MQRAELPSGYTETEIKDALQNYQDRFNEILAQRNEPPQENLTAVLAAEINNEDGPIEIAPTLKKLIHDTFHPGQNNPDSPVVGVIFTENLAHIVMQSAKTEGVIAFHLQEGTYLGGIYNDPNHVVTPEGIPFKDAQWLPLNNPHHLFALSNLLLTTHLRKNSELYYFERNKIR